MDEFVNGRVLDDKGLRKLFGLLKGEYHINEFKRLNVYKVIDRLGTLGVFYQGNLLITKSNINRLSFSKNLVNSLIFNYSENDIKITLPNTNKKYEGDIAYLDNNIFTIPGNSLLNIKKIEIGSESFILLELKKYQKI